MDCSNDCQTKGWNRKHAAGFRPQPDHARTVSAPVSAGILEALPMILDKTGSHQQIGIEPGDMMAGTTGPIFTNPVVLIIIRKK
jgi:hypothetical protein